MTFHFEWHSILSEFQFLVTFHFEWHFIFGDIPFWVSFQFEWHSILSDISFWVTGLCLNLNNENWGGIGLSISNLYVSQSFSESQSLELEILAHLKILGCINRIGLVEGDILTSVKIKLFTLPKLIFSMLAKQIVSSFTTEFYQLTALLTVLIRSDRISIH